MAFVTVAQAIAASQRIRDPSELRKSLTASGQAPMAARFNIFSLIPTKTPG